MLFNLQSIYKLCEFMRDFGISRTAVYQGIKAGRLRNFKIGTGTRLAGEDGMAWRESSELGGGIVCITNNAALAGAALRRLS